MSDKIVSAAKKWDETRQALIDLYARPAAQHGPVPALIDALAKAECELRDAIRARSE